MIKRRSALKIIFEEIRNKKAIVITTTGLIGREAFEIVGYQKHFYMAGSMGLVSSIGLGVAISQPHVKVICIDGDGSFLMNLGGICAIGYWKAPNLIHIIFDNGVYFSTGGMKTYSSTIDFEKLVKSVGYENIQTVRDEKKLRSVIKDALNKKQLTFIRVFIQPRGKRKLPRPKEMNMFVNNIRKFLKQWENEK